MPSTVLSSGVNSGKFKKTWSLLSWPYDFSEGDGKSKTNLKGQRITNQDECSEGGEHVSGHVTKEMDLD